MDAHLQHARRPIVYPPLHRPPDGQRMGNDVDLAMAGWQQLAQNPDKMGELMKAFKDPDVWAKAQEMMKDPEYMAAAKAKMAELQAKAQANGLLDQNGQPVPGAAGAATTHLCDV